MCWFIMTCKRECNSRDIKGVRELQDNSQYVGLKRLVKEGAILVASSESGNCKAICNKLV